MADGRLAEVEEDAIYITEKRFAEDREERAREKAKQERQALRDAKTKGESADSKDAETQVSSITASTPTELNAPVEEKKEEPAKKKGK